MIWSLVGNKALDAHTRNMQDLHWFLGTPACQSSPLDRKDIEDLEKVCEKYNRIVTRVYKRVQKAAKEKEKRERKKK